MEFRATAHIRAHRRAMAIMKTAALLAMSGKTSSRGSDDSKSPADKIASKLTAKKAMKSLGATGENVVDENLLQEVSKDSAFANIGRGAKIPGAAGKLAQLRVRVKDVRRGSKEEAGAAAREELPPPKLKVHLEKLNRIAPEPSPRTNYVY